MDRLSIKITELSNNDNKKYVIPIIIFLIESSIF